MKVLHVIETLSRGGAEQALVNVLPSLMELGVDVEVCALFPPYTLGEELARRGVAVHRLDIPHRWDLPHAVPRVAALLRRSYQVLHGHSFFPALYVALARPPKTSRRFITFHSLDYDSYPAVTAWHRSRKRLEAWLMNQRIDVRLAVSPAVAAHYREHLNLRQVDVVYNAIQVGQPDALSERERRTILQRFGLSERDQVLLVPGRFVHEKGHRFFIDAFRLLQTSHPRLRGLFIGDGPLKADIERTLRAKELDEFIIVHPSVPHRELMTLLSVAGIIVIPSTHEGFPLAPAEGMALGKPVVATSVGGIPLLIENEVSGLLVPPANPAALAAAIDRLLADGQLRDRLGRLGRMRVDDHFSPAAIAKQLLSIYTRAASE